MHFFNIYLYNILIINKIYKKIIYCITILQFYIIYIIKFIIYINNTYHYIMIFYM